MKEEDIRKREIFNRYIELSAIDAENYFSDKSSYININCPACEAENMENSFTKYGFSYCTCQACDTLFVNPRPSLAQFERFYADSPSTSFWVNEFFKPVAEARRMKMFKPRAEFVSDYFQEATNITIGDIGGGFGIFLEELNKIRPEFNLIAIEPSLEMVEICREKGLRVIPKMIEAIEGHDTSFDVLIAFELFEHLHTPKNFVRKIYNLLKPGGILIFTTLNGLGFDIQILWEKSKSISPPHHLNFFNPRSASKLLENNGFEILEASTPGKLDWDIIEGGMTSGEINPGRLWKSIAKYTSKSDKENLQSWISKSNMSSHMRIIAKKSI